MARTQIISLTRFMGKLTKLYTKFRQAMLLPTYLSQQVLILLYSM